MSVFLRSTVTGTTTLQTVSHTDWLDQFDHDWRYSQIFRISFQSLRVGRIQFAMVHDGLIIKVAEILNDNLRATGYWQYANLPPYWKIYNDGANTVTEFGYGDELNGVGFRYVHSGTIAAAQALAICSTVKSQGGGRIENLPGTPWVTPIPSAKTVSTTLIPVLSLRVGATFNSLVNRASVVLQGYTIATTQPIDFAIIYRPALTGASWSAIDATYNGVEYDVTASAITGGYRIAGDYTAASVSNPTRVSGLLDRVLMSLGSGTSDIISLSAIRAGSSDASVRAYLSGKELR
jgi:hypothetical protein